MSMPFNEIYHLFSVTLVCAFVVFYYSMYILVMCPYFFLVNMHDCGFFMLQNCKSYHCRDDGVIELLDYTHVEIPAIRKTLLYTCTTSELFNVDFRGLFGI